MTGRRANKWRGRASRRGTGCRGHALLGTMAFLVLAMLMWLAAFAHVGGYIRVEKACQLRNARSDGPTRAMAWGLTLLEGGVPPSNPYSCRMAVNSGLTYVVTFNESPQWTFAVTARLAGPADGQLPAAPAQFAKR